LLIEQNASTSDEPKAISLDDESIRIMAQAGLAEPILDIVVPGSGTAYFDRNRRLLFRGASPAPFGLGYPFKNPFAQPELEALLRSALERY
jgi:3-(3-hydroxy-phenyl)propionate hydroxylase